MCPCSPSIDPHPASTAIAKTRSFAPCLLKGLVGVLVSTGAHAHDPIDTSIHEVTVRSTREDLQGVATTASEGVVTPKHLRTRPLLRAGDVMESVPGLVATQHAGEGKANQYYLRGFNLDHGTDLATTVDGVLVNLPTHAHGQGYTDLGFLIPELIESVQYRKGPYSAEDGDFAAAGAVHLRTVRRVNHPFGSIQLGGFGHRRALAVESLKVKGGDLLIAGEQLQDDGPWTVKQGLRRTNLLAKYTQGNLDNGWGLGLTHYEAAWTSTDQIPQRAVDAGLIGRYGSLDPTAGGQTRRTGLNANWAHTDKDGQTRLNVYALRYAFDLFSQFTYYTRGCSGKGSSPSPATLPAACNGSTPLDQFSQTDRRNALGLSLSHRLPLTVPAHLPLLGGIDALVTLGTNLRRDNMGEVGLYDTLARVRTDTVRRDRVQQNAIGLWTQAELQLAPKLRSVLGLRLDRQAADVQSSIAANSGRSTATLRSPKASLVYSPSHQIDLYANWGRGFHSNDARGTVMKADPRDPTLSVKPATALVAATGYEVGARQQWHEQLSTTVALWVMKLNSELLFVGDAGTTEASRPSLRRGIEVTSNWRPGRTWDIDADLSLSRARFTNADSAGDFIPGSMERVASLGITYQSGPWTVGSRIRHFGPRALIEDNSIRGSASTLVNFKAAYRMSPNAELALEVFNLFNRQANDTEYAYASRLPGEAAFVEGGTRSTLHFHPSLPRTARVGLKFWF